MEPSPEVAVPRWQVAAALPAALVRVLRIRRAVRRSPAPASLLPAVTPPARGGGRSSARRRLRTVRAVQYATHLFPTNPEGDCLVRSLAVYAALREQGWPVRFVSGVRRGASGVQGHAWVELDGRVLWELGEPRNRELYRVNFAYPAE